MQNQNIEKEKTYRVVRQYHDKENKIEYDLFMVLKPRYKRVTTVQTKTIAEGCNTSVFAFVVEDETMSKATLEIWNGQKDSVSGNMSSKRVFAKSVDMNIVHLLISELTSNAFAIPNNSELVVTISEKVMDFARMEQNKAQKKIG